MLSLILYKNYFKKILSLFLLIFFYSNIVLAESKLPKCIGEDDTKWKNCFGSYLNKDITRSGSPNVFTSDYIGEFGSVAGKREGKGSTIRYKDGKLYFKFVGEFIYDQEDGQGVATYFDGTEYVGEWKNGQKHGHGSYSWPDGQKYIGEWLYDKTNGHGTLTWIDGETYVGEFANGLRHGQGTANYADGSKYVGEFKKDERSGQGTYTWTDGETYVGEWKNNLRNGQGTANYADGSKYVGEWKDDKKISSKDTTESLADTEIDLEKEKRKLEEELSKLKEEKKKVQQEAEKQKKIKKQQDNIIDKAFKREEERGIEFAQDFIIDLQDFINSNPDEFDILEIIELMVDNKIILDGKWNSELKKSFDLLMDYTMKSERFKDYYEEKFFGRIDISLNEFNSEVENLENKIAVLKKYLQENLNSKAAEKIVHQIRAAEKVLNDPNLENLIKTNKEMEILINSLNNTKSKKTVKKKISKLKSVSEIKSSIKGSPKERIIKILSELNINYSDIKFSRNEEDFIIYDFDIDGQTIKEVEVEGLNKVYIEGFFEIITNGSTDYFKKYNGKYFDQIKLSGINNFKFDNNIITGKEIGISNLDFKKFDIFKKLINSKSLSEQDINLISYLISMSFDNLYYKDISLENSSNNEKYFYEYFLISKWKELSVDKILLKNSSILTYDEKFTLEEWIIEKIALDKNEIFAFLNSDYNSNTFFLNNDFSFLLNGIKSLKNFEITNFAAIQGGKKFADIKNVALKDINFDYFGTTGDKKVPVSFKIDVEAANITAISDQSGLMDLIRPLKYDSIKFDFGGEWKWNTRRNNLSINLNLGVTDAASIKLSSSFTDLSTDILELKGAPLGTYLMTNPKIKNLNLTIKDNSLKNRLIAFGAMEEDMTSKQYKDFLTQSLNIFVTTFSTKNILVESMQKAITNFINDSDNITLSIKPSQPLSITDLIPHFKEGDADKIINKLNLKISNNLF